MALITKNHTFSSGAVILASEHNDNFDTVYNAVNGNLSNANISGSASIAASKLNLATISQSITFTGNNTFAGTTIADLGAVTTADINGGTVDAVIGGTTPAAGTFTNLTANTDLTLASGATVTAILDEDDLSSDSATALATQQSIKAYADAISAHDYAVGATEYLLASLDTERLKSSSESYTLTKQIILARSGTLRIDFEAYVASANGGVRIYRNGSPVGTDNVISDTSYSGTPTTEDISGWSEGDLCQLYYKTGSGGTTRVKNFRIYATAPTVETTSTDQN